MKKVHELEVGELKRALKDVPNDVKVIISSDQGIDQPRFGDAIICESARYKNYKLPKGQRFEDFEGDEIKEFEIYVSEISFDEYEVE